MAQMNRAVGWCQAPFSIASTRKTPLQRMSGWLRAPARTLRLSSAFFVARLYWSQKQWQTATITTVPQVASGDLVVRGLGRMRGNGLDGKDNDRRTLTSRQQTQRRQRRGRTTQGGIR